MHGNGNGKTETKKHYWSYNKLKCIGIRELNFGLKLTNKIAPQKARKAEKEEKGIKTKIILDICR